MYNFQVEDFHIYYFGETIVEIIVQEVEKMNLYKNGYVVSEVKDNDYTYNVWPFEDMYNDNIAMLLTEEADENCVLYSRNGDINISGSEINYNGIIYAPNGIVTISANDVCISGTIIAKKVIVYGNDVTFK